MQDALPSFIDAVKKQVVLPLALGPPRGRKRVVIAFERRVAYAASISLKIIPTSSSTIAIRPHVQVVN